MPLLSNSISETSADMCSMSLAQLMSVWRSTFLSFNFGGFLAFTNFASSSDVFFSERNCTIKSFDMELYSVLMLTGPYKVLY